MLKNFKKFVSALVLSAVVLSSCSQDETALVDDFAVDDITIEKIKNLGFNVTNNAPTKFEDGYLIEGDIYLTDADINNMSKPSFLPVAEQYSTNNLVIGTRVITMYAEEGGRDGYSAGMIAGLDEAIIRYNAMNLVISFQRITTNNADITMTRLRKGDERRGILGSAGFPTASGDPFNEIKMSGILESSYGLSTDGIATIIAHEMGHCVGFRHTDYFDRSISCGGGTSNEGDGGVGANHIPG
jgi:hypothetical protein